MEPLPVDRFVPYGPSHWVLMVLIVAGSVALPVLGHRNRDPRTTTLFTRIFAVVVLAFNVPLLIYQLLPAQWNIAESLPLQLCDFAWMVAAYALWTRQPLSYALVYYWGLTLTPQAMITPALDAPDFPNIHFIQFWGQHLLVIWAAAYLTWGVGMRPNWRGYWFSAGVTLVWIAAMLAFNAWAGTNYGFVSRKPDNPSLLDVMGGWPWYLGVGVAIGLAAWALLTWPWTRTPRESGSAARTGT
ncbi:YwaF family protein [Saccharopolyspora phatthalungensis]|uniref:Putative integral membrane protein (TIGR02206 family) n=1 Tax=Saccharopolyspora phatthalungensis TaxID=664693 RepID=A0A840PY98_9PSEU|nr:TIGR02206 family membrane protein [Saccharopolyspora phatthalungensis]MBB5152730.1 putative integral membrane protein (TIGR02206 family) [Saccharopolyspora phatthalungensis]